MVKFQTSLLLALLCPFSVLAKPFLEAQIKSDDIELGKPAYIKITAEGYEQLRKLSEERKSKFFKKRIPFTSGCSAESCSITFHELSVLPSSINTWKIYPNPPAN